MGQPIIARSRRVECEIEQVLPGADSDDPFSDAMKESIERWNSHDNAEDETDSQRDLPERSSLPGPCPSRQLYFLIGCQRMIRHYEVGFQIGQLTLGKNFDGLLGWGWIDSRPFLRCMHGFDLSLWRLGRHLRAHAVAQSSRQSGHPLPV